MIAVFWQDHPRDAVVMDAFLDHEKGMYVYHTMLDNYKGTIGKVWYEEYVRKEVPVDKLTMFLYILLRDEVVPGTVEAIMAQHVDKAVSNPESIYSNPYLTEYAKSLAARLTQH